MEQQRIVCAANRDTKTGEIILGARHWDSSMYKAFRLWEKATYRVHAWVMIHSNERRFTEQGFIDQYGKFLNRKEAWKVAEAAGQILYRCGGDDTDGGTLYSENLY